MMKRVAYIYLLWIICEIAPLRYGGQSKTLHHIDDIGGNNSTGVVFKKMLRMLTVQEKISEKMKMPPQPQQELPYKNLNAATNLSDKDVEDSTWLEWITENKEVQTLNTYKRVGARSIRSVPEPRENVCRRHDLWVDFDTLRNGTLPEIILSNGMFNAYICRGACDYPLAFGTAHSLIQSKLHSEGREGVEAPCCVPTKLGSIQVLSMNSDFDIVNLNISGVVVEECGCL